MIMALPNTNLGKRAKQDLFNMIDEFNAAKAVIPRDKNCKKCPYSDDGQSRGMITPCFDICDDRHIVVRPYSSG